MLYAYIHNALQICNVLNRINHTYKSNINITHMCYIYYSSLLGLT